MSKQKRNWNQSEKLEILEYYKQNGLGRTVRQYNVSQTSIYKWRDRYEAEGVEGLAIKTRTVTPLESDYQQLLRENKELKAIVAEKELELRIKTEMLKKSR